MVGKFLPVYWSPIYFPNQPGTKGVLVQPEYKAFDYFPTSFHSDWQWWDHSVNAKTVQVDSLNDALIVRMIYNFITNRNMATVLELKLARESCSLAVMTFQQILRTGLE
ncbi:hypothetical protein [uncultured Salegentibacter sp.]|uniref:hypothetical protein n=1 Tax=uncultured Salegentibacter sp. TaxID=259320 RepID=UPI00259A015D|nr:hypothetical protein [uncultured Salegentibacter sp.]